MNANCEYEFEEGEYIEEDELVASTGSTTQQSEKDDTELLREQLLKSMHSQIGKKENRKQNQSVESQKLQTKQINQQKGKSTRALSSVGNLNISIELAKLTTKLEQAQKRKAEIVQRKTELQQSLSTCYVDLERSQEKIDSLVKNILALCNNQVVRQPSNGNKTKQKNNITHPEQTSENATEHSKERSQVEMRKEFSSSASLNLAASNKLTDQVQTSGHEQQQENFLETLKTAISEVQSQQFAIESVGNIVRERIAELHANKKNESPTMLENAELEEGQISDQNIGQFEVDEINERISTKPIEIDNEKQQKQQDEKISITVGTPKEIEMMEIDPFLLSIRTYRLGSNFPQKYLVHPAVSHRLNPFIHLCPFQLHGRCADRNCPYQHEEEYLLTEQQIIEELLNHYPKLCPRVMKPEDYASRLLAEAPFDQVAGFLISRMPDDIRTVSFESCNKGSSGSVTWLNKPIPQDDPVEYESCSQKPLTMTKQQFYIENINFS